MRIALFQFLVVELCGRWQFCSLLSFIIRRSGMEIRVEVPRGCERSIDEECDVVRAEAVLHHVLDRISCLDFIGCSVNAECRKPPLEQRRLNRIRQPLRIPSKSHNTSIRTEGVLHHEMETTHLQIHSTTRPTMALSGASCIHTQYRK